MKKVAVALSGGVDSSVAAYLLKQQKYNLIGVIFKLNQFSSDFTAKKNLAHQVANKLNIPLQVVDLSEQFEKHVIDYFKNELQAGRTPNPCVVCNYWIKFGALLDYVVNDLGVDKLATGHYARIVCRDAPMGRLPGDAPAARLYKAENAAKDQSYFLHSLTQKQLSQLLFPLGNMESKDQVYEVAKEQGFPTAYVSESQDICFSLPSISENPGSIKNTNGDTIGKHRGLAFYTIGQREGLGVSASEPLYVVGKDTENNEIIVGPKKLLYRNEILLEGVNIISDDYTAREFEANVQVRYNANEMPARVTLLKGRKARVSLLESVLSPTPGQFAVFYNNEECLGGGVITD